MNRIGMHALLTQLPLEVNGIFSHLTSPLPLDPIFSDTFQLDSSLVDNLRTLFSNQKSLFLLLKSPAFSSRIPRPIFDTFSFFSIIHDNHDFFEEFLNNLIF